MRDVLLQCSGLAAIAVALIHGVLGETKVFARATIEPPSPRATSIGPSRGGRRRPCKTQDDRARRTLRTR